MENCSIGSHHNRSVKDVLTRSCFLLLWGIAACSGGGGSSPPSTTPPPPPAVADTTPPSPNPLTFAIVPEAVANTEITMTAVTATDSSGVEYFFEEMTGGPGATSSGWQTSPTYTDSGLTPGTSYTYRVRARDRSANMNLVNWSPSASVTTPNNPPGVSDTPRMSLAGERAFLANGSGGTINWSVDRLTRSEFSGSENFESGIFTTTGASVRFDLEKIPNQETIYEITVTDASFTETQRVQVFPAGQRSVYTHESAGNPDVSVHLMVPQSLNAETKIISLHHGTGRNAIGAIENWQSWARQNNYITLAPEFDRANWPSSRSYNLGNMFTGSDGTGSLNPESRWSYTVARDIAVNALADFGLDDTQYDIWGHSAGGQFTHRMMIFRPDAPIRFAMPVNPGWWTLPTLNEDYPYGLRHPDLSYTEQDIQDWTNRPMIIFRGVNDLGSQDLRVTPEANAQGPNRFERAKFFFDRGLVANPNNQWELRTIDGCGHSASCMTPSAQEFLDATTAP